MLNSSRNVSSLELHGIVRVSKCLPIHKLILSPSFPVRWVLGLPSASIPGKKSWAQRVVMHGNLLRMTLAHLGSSGAGLLSVGKHTATLLSPAISFPILVYSYPASGAYINALLARGREREREGKQQLSAECQAGELPSHRTKLRSVPAVSWVHL